MHAPDPRRVAIALLLTGAGAVSLSGCGKTTEAAQSQPAVAQKAVTITVLPARMMPIQRKVHIVGELSPLETVTLSNRVTGTVNEVKFDVGDEVPPSKAGAKVTMLSIEPKRFRMGVLQGRQDLNEVLAKLGRAERVSETTPVDEKHPVLDWSAARIEDTAPYRKAQSEFDTATKKYAKAKPLYDQKLMREIEWGDYENAVEVAKSNLQVAADEARALIAQAQGLEAMLQIKQKDFDDATIYAPGDVSSDRTQIKRYWVKERHVAAGEYLKEGTVLYVLAADEPIKLMARVPERELSRVAVGDTIDFKVEAYPNKSFQGYIKVINATVDPANRTFTVEGRVDNVPAAENGIRMLRAGQFVQGDINVGQKDQEKVLFVPVASVTSFVGENKIFVVDDNGEGKVKVRQVPVEIDQQVGEWVEVRAKDPKRPIKAGDKVAVDGVSKLIDQSPVVVQDKVAATSTAPATTAVSTATTSATDTTVEKP
jgi:membrane fusion protein (multidrug efflux system)